MPHNKDEISIDGSVAQRRETRHNSTQPCILYIDFTYVRPLECNKKNRFTYVFLLENNVVMYFIFKKVLDTKMVLFYKYF